MNYLNIETCTLRSPEFIECEPVHRAAWLCLLGYCCEQENSGIIKGCKSWGDRRWQATCGVMKSEVVDCALYHFEGDDLHLHKYPLEKQEMVALARLSGAKGGKKSGAARRKKSQSKDLSEPPDEATLEATLQSDPSRGRLNGKEGKGKEENKNILPPTSPGGDVVDDDGPEKPDYLNSDQWTLLQSIWRTGKLDPNRFPPESWHEVLRMNREFDCSDPDMSGGLIVNVRETQGRIGNSTSFFARKMGLLTQADQSTPLDRLPDDYILT